MNTTLDNLLALTKESMVNRNIPFEKRNGQMSCGADVKIVYRCSAGKNASLQEVFLIKNKVVSLRHVGRNPVVVIEGERMFIFINDQDQNGRREIVFSHIEAINQPLVVIFNCDLGIIPYDEFKRIMLEVAKDKAKKRL